ncbi:hypothetical protein SB48_HM08orf04471 [Heyndrickxia coagulans]|uniref:Uncharacterized protein n=1 Tax=Heyndrickxia coagulans TaxID=1398 RepID=A0AAN0T6X0_HEYCO|nr:hypothetical protein SB48_HM08orf04471 [Heyndrickxia coagulans]
MRSFLKFANRRQKNREGPKRDPAPQSGLRGIGSNKNTLNILAEK